MTCNHSSASFDVDPDTGDVWCFRCDSPRKINQEAQPITTHLDLRIVRRYSGKPFGIRDRDGFLMFFPQVSRFTDQDERYQREMAAQEDMALYLLTALQARQKAQP